MATAAYVKTITTYTVSLYVMVKDRPKNSLTGHATWDWVVTYTGISQTKANLALDAAQHKGKAKLETVTVKL